MDKLKNLPPQYKLLIGVGVLGLLAAGYYYLVIMSIDELIMQQKGAYAGAQKELAEFKDFRGELEIAELREQYAEVVRQIEENKRLIPDKELLPQLMSGLESDALEAGLTVISKEQKAKEIEDFYYRIPIKFEVAGSFLNLTRFLKLVTEEDKRLVNVSTFDVKVLGTQKRKKVTSATSPFGSSAVAARAESDISATFIVEGFTYTGGDKGDGAKKKKKAKGAKQGGKKK